MRPAFSERTFEFCFNAEFCRKFSGRLASHPQIPSQKMEKDLGYDVEFEIQAGRFTGSIFFQHKVASFAEHRVGTNAHFFDAHGGSYYRFGVDNPQHNVLQDLSLTKGNAFYCAPAFHKRDDLSTYFFADRVGNYSVLLDPADVGAIQDNARHNVSYVQGGAAFLHSEQRRFEKSVSASREKPPEFRRQKINEDYVIRLKDELIRKTPERRVRRAISAGVDALRPLEQVQLVLARVYDVSWILIE
ncbi:MAG: adenylosuccinate lyase [Proteobacteria bacterium]|nr:adenylosuccinate lyase [Pseudomonadota bacterium]